MSELPLSNDPYEVLGVARDVSEKDLKRRYFALLRQFPPETHPDEFNRVQRAYDVLKDPEARAALESTGPFHDVEEPYRTRLREILQNLDSERADFARVELKTLVEERPDLSEARNLLQQVLFRQGQHDEAEAEARELVQQAPKNPFFRYRWALSLRTLNRVDEAIAQVEVWRELTEQKAVEPWQFLAELLVVQGKVDEAIACLSDGMLHVQHPLALLLSRTRMYANGTYPGRLTHDLAELRAGLPESDPQERGEVAARLYSVAATYFDRGKPEEANQILREAHALRDKGEVLQFPPLLQFNAGDLPTGTRAWLEQEAKDVHIFRVAKAASGERTAVDWVSVVLLAAVVGIGVSAEKWSWLGALSCFGFLAIFLGLTVEAITRRLRPASDRLPPMISLHPWYLLSTDDDKLSVYPLVNLTEIAPATSHQLLSVRLKFGTHVLFVNIADPDLTQRFVDSIANLRLRTLDLLDTAMIEADQGHELIPAPMLNPAWKSPLAEARRKARRHRILVTTAFSALITLGLAHDGMQIREIRAWAKAVNTPSWAALAAASVTAPSLKEKELLAEVRARRLAQSIDDLSAHAKDEPHRRRILSWARRLEQGPVSVAWKMSALEAPPGPVWEGIQGELERTELAQLLATRAPPQLKDSLLRSRATNAEIRVSGSLKPGPARLRWGEEPIPLPELELVLDTGDEAPLTIVVGLEISDLRPLSGAPDLAALGRGLGQPLAARAARQLAIELGLTPLDRR